MPNTKILPDKEGESYDTTKKFTNIDSEDFEFTWDGIKYTVKAGETVTYPKYLVNYAAMHLAKKIVKREVRAEQKDDEHVRQGMYSVRNPEKEMELQQKMVAVNFPKKVEEKPIEGGKTEEINEFKCATCGFQAKSKAGLSVHSRKHK
jgi:hypothetical protein